MKVSELITKLKEMPQDAPVHIRDMEWRDTLDLERVIYLTESQDENTPANTVVLE